MTNTEAKRKVPEGFHGKKGRSGRRKTIGTLVKEIMETDAQQLPAYFLKLGELAKNGDREALVYLIDRHLGKAKATTDINIEGAEMLGSGVVAELFKAMSQRQQELAEAQARLQLKEGED